MTTAGNGEFPTVIGPDAVFKGELTFEKGLRVQGGFEGKVRTKGSLHIAGGAKVAADIEAGELQVEGELKGNVNISGKLTLTNSARMEGDLRTSRLEMADGAVFIGNVVVGQNGAQPSAAAPRRESTMPAFSAPAASDMPPMRPRPMTEPAVLGVPSLTVPAR